MSQKRLPNNLGKLAEDIASDIIFQKGYKVLDRNFRSRFGEIDIVAIKDSCLVFVEVKARWTNKFGAPEEAVTWSKLGKIKKTGEYYSLIHPELPKKLRIDVVALEMRGKILLSYKIINVGA